MKYTLSIVVENQPGVLSKVVSLFSRRGYNIDSLTVAAGEDPRLSHITIVGEGDNYTLEQVEKQLNKLIPVIKVREMGEIGNFVQGELIFIKIGYKKKELPEISQMIQLMQAEAVNFTAATMTVKFAGAHERCDALCELLRPYGIKRIVRSGVIAMEGGT